MNLYSNLPSKTSTADATVKAFDANFNKPLELNASVLNAMTAFFEGRGFEPGAAQSIAVIIIKQAKHDNYNPMIILDTLKGLDTVEISALVAEILNYNRVKTSFLGYARQFNPSDETIRNIIA